MTTVSSMATTERRSFRITRTSYPRPVIIVAATILIAGVFAVPPLVGLPGGTTPADAALVFPRSYILLAPVCSTLDALTLLTIRQHLAVLAFVLLLYGLARVSRGRWRRRSIVHTSFVELAGAVLTVATIVGIYVVGALAPRPMAALRSLEAEDVVVDFHSHTERSHDGRDGFTATANRLWHQSGGFDVAFVTDHGEADLAVAVGIRNPPRSGAGTILLPGREFVHRGKHLVELGPWAPGDVPPVWIQTLPEDLSEVPVPAPDGHGGVLAIELVDAAPRGLAQMDRERAVILHLADSLNLSVVASSNNHGWGRTTAAWSILRIPGWRSLTPDALGRAIADEIRSRRRTAVRIVARRRVAEANTTLGLVFTGPVFVAQLLRTLTWPERLMWVVWLLLGSACAMLLSAGSSQVLASFGPRSPRKAVDRRSRGRAAPATPTDSPRPAAAADAPRADLGLTGRPR